MIVCVSPLKTKGLDMFGSCDISVTLWRKKQKEMKGREMSGSGLKRILIMELNSSWSTTIECGTEEQFN